MTTAGIIVVILPILLVILSFFFREKKIKMYVNKKHYTEVRKIVMDYCPGISIIRESPESGIDFILIEIQYDTKEDLLRMRKKLRDYYRKSEPKFYPHANQ